MREQKVATDKEGVEAGDVTYLGTRNGPDSHHPPAQQDFLVICLPRKGLGAS